MIPYFVFIILFELFLGGYKFKGRKVSVSISILATFLLLTFTLIRFDVGYDYANYYNLVLNERVSALDLLFLEPTARYAILFSQNINFPPAIIMIYGIISIIVTSIAIRRNSLNLSLSFLVFIGLFYLQTLCFIRQGAALAIILLSFPYIRNGNRYQFLLCCLLATILHFSAIITIIIYPLYNLFNYKKLGAFIFIGSILLLLFIKIIPTIFPNLPYINYFETAEKLNGGNMAKYIFLLSNCVGLILSIRAKNIELTKFFEIGMIGVIFPFALGGHIGGRIGWYFLIFLCITLPNILFRYNYIFSRICNVVMVTCFLGMVFISSLSSGKTQFTPYQTIFEVDIYNPNFKSE